MQSVKKGCRFSVASAIQGERHHGFTLIEVMIVVAILAILAAIAYPNYAEHLFKSRRADGQSALMRVELEQQKRRASGLAYATNLSDLGVAATSPDGHYSLTLSASSGGYTATATPAGRQAGDSCGALTIVLSSGVATYGSSLSGQNCWGQ